MKFFAVCAILLIVGVCGDEEEHQASRLRLDDVPQLLDSFQRNSPALNQLFATSVNQSWKYGQLAAKGVQSELSAKSRNVLRELRKIATKHTLNVRSDYQKLDSDIQKNLQGAIPMIQDVVKNYDTIKPIIEIVRRELPNGFLATLTS